ncbi:hypothetical protein [Nannocystis pusilla]|uniref:hypothetical protein n=1 Tax=Nannocystis pusilla TaxID=889268 RepID=UPI003DA4027F
MSTVAGPRTDRVQPAGAMKVLPVTVVRGASAVRRSGAAAGVGAGSAAGFGVGVLAVAAGAGASAPDGPQAARRSARATVARMAGRVPRPPTRRYRQRHLIAGASSSTGIGRKRRSRELQRLDPRPASAATMPAGISRISASTAGAGDTGVIAGGPTSNQHRAQAVLRHLQQLALEPASGASGAAGIFSGSSRLPSVASVTAGISRAPTSNGIGACGIAGIFDAGGLARADGHIGAALRDMTLQACPMRHVRPDMPFGACPHLRGWIIWK